MGNTCSCAQKDIDDYTIKIDTVKDKQTTIHDDQLNE